MNNLPAKPKIKDTWCVIPTDKYVLFRGKGLFKVEGKSLKEFLELLLPLLKGDHSLEEILNILGEYYEEDIITAINMLNNVGILEDSSVKIPKKLSKSELWCIQSNLEYFSRFPGDKYKPLNNIKKARVIILGAGTLGCSIAYSLAASGVRRILLVDNEKLRLKDLDPFPDIGTAGINHNHTNIKILYKELDYRDISRLTGRYDLLICAPDTYRPSIFNLVNKACLENGIPWIPIYFLEEECFVGPLTVSKEGSCYNCFQTRLLNNSEHLEEDKLFNDYLQENGQRIKYTIPRFYSDVISKLAVIEIINFLSKTKTPSTVDNVYIQNFETLSGRVHRIRKVPNCPVCSGGSRGKLSISTFVNKERERWVESLHGKRVGDGDIRSLIKELETLEDEKTGIIKRSLQSSGSKYLNLFGTHGWLVICSSPNRLLRPHDFVFSGGSGETYEDAKCSALVEAIERYCCEGRDAENLIRATYKGVRKHAINPREVVLFSENQYQQENLPWKRFSENAPISWTSGFNLITEEPVLIPADFVYTGASRDRLCAETSNGAAAHISRVEATLAGIFEIIERDGLMIMWFNRLPMPKISIDSLPFELLRIVRKVNDFGFGVIIQNVTTDIGVPAFCVFIVNRHNKKPALFSGAGCHLNPEIALTKGIRESLRSFAYYLANPKEIEEAKILGFDHLRRPEDHGNLYFAPEMFKYLDFFIESERYQNYDDIKDLWTKDSIGDMVYCLSIFKKKKMDVIAVDCTTSDVSNTGVYVVKVIIPGMQPIGFGMVNQRYGGRRLYDVPKELGYTKLTTREEDLNTIPHFFT
jgi:ribosomal protein S12 methylthiotransferase accessory factor